ncbi:phosphotransferase enzyme family protein [Cytobacillus sp. IB215665]|uniref:phosphotransferase enzyme family protein n=1 Tax=Cytobacillus sp. IB215665 TaxID=3097357 RepID=UPI002A0F532A|nr:phosphotransferase [Cytobacillus sp. IB215665]MDX8365333.1 phosphotransferase [Cytobacillus sp. IB215665]
MYNIEQVEQLLNNHFKLNVHKISSLGWNDNMTFLIEAHDNNKYVFKQHLGTKTANMIESELLWLKAIAKDTNLNVQRTIKNTFDELTTLVFDKVTGTSFYWTLQVYIVGETLKGQPSESEIENLAQLMVTLHEHSINWNIPDGFERPIYEIEDLKYSLQQLKKMVSIRKMTSNDFEIIEKATKEISLIIKDQDKTKDTWGLIHADLHESNYVFYQGQPAPIDFSSCGFGFYLYDIAITFLHLNPQGRKKLISYYQKGRNLQDDYIQVLEAFFLWAIIKNLAFLAKNQKEHKEFANIIPFLVKNCVKFLQGEKFLL